MAEGSSKLWINTDQSEEMEGVLKYVGKVAVWSLGVAASMDIYLSSPSAITAK